MIKHIVFWNLNPEDRQEHAEGIRERLEGLVGKIDGLLFAEVRQNFNPKGFDLCLYTEFSTREALDAYQAHPLHLAAKEYVHSAVHERVVVDYEA